MSKSNASKKILITGASGYLGRSLCEVLAEDHDLLRMDVTATSGAGEMITGSVCDHQLLDGACARADALVLAHMAPNRTAAYDRPDLCMDINVKGVALALEAAVRNRIKRVVLISSVSVVWGHVLNKTFLTTDLSPRPMELYGMTKVLQEDIASFYHRMKGLEIAVLRPAAVLREDSLVNKYGETSSTVTWQCIDPRDIARAVHGALQAPDLRHEIFYLMAGPDAERYADIETTRERLNWNPEHRFQGIPVEVL
ncbi:MAG TPA: NAD(P)-dependent oxidoreductase [Rariglobus sp.]|jgi:nucleoside-diphosphate-sugar epimerase